MNNNLTILIPIHSLDIDRKYISDMFESVSKQTDKGFTLAVATYPEYKEQINNMNIFDLKITYIDLPEEMKALPLPNYTEIINFAVHSINTKRFTILQYDDVLNNIFVEVTEQYAKAYPEVAAFVPISLEFDGESFVRMANESVWNLNFTEKQGFFDFESLRNYFNFSFVSTIFDTEIFVKNVGFKHSIKKYFEQEFFLRLLYQQHEVMVIPKFMVRHTVNRQNSIADVYSKLPILEQRFYQDVAKKEYYFAEDRNLIYEEQVAG